MKPGDEFPCSYCKADDEHRPWCKVVNPVGWAKRTGEPLAAHYGSSADPASDRSPRQP